MGDVTAIALSVVASASTFIGGLLALRATATLRYFFAFSAGTLLAMALADLLPEAMALSSTTPGYRVVVCYVILASFVLFHIVERYVLVHHVHGDQREATVGTQAHTESHTAGGLGAAGLVAHSILDGVVIGAAFQASANVGLIVALAVVSHDFADGVNTVILTRRVSKNRRRALAFLVADAAAPVAGAVTTLLIHLPEQGLALVLAFFVGHFLYIGASDLIPEMHRGERSWSVVAVHLAGVLAIVLLTQLITL